MDFKAFESHVNESRRRWENNFAHKRNLQNHYYSLCERFPNETHDIDCPGLFDQKRSAPEEAGPSIKRQHFGTGSEKVADTKHYSLERTGQCHVKKIPYYRFED